MKGILILAVLAIAGCSPKEVPDKTPVTEVNKPRPKKIVEPTNELGVPLTNVPKTSTATNK